MEIKEPDYKNLSEIDHSGVSSQDSPSLLNLPINDILQKLKENPSKIDRNLLLDYLRATCPTNVYKLAKDTGFAYTSLKAIIREFEFVGLIYSIVKINDSNQAIKEYYMKEQEEKK